MNLIRTLVAATAAGFLTAGMGAAPARAAEIPMAIDNFTFSPQQITVKIGDTVIWTNRDDIPHTATSTTKSFGSKVLDTNESFSFTFATPGSFSYFCALHPHMTGSVVVEANAGG